MNRQTILELAILELALQPANPSCLQSGSCAIFVSSATWVPGSGIASADAVCQAESGATAFPGTYKALLMTEDGARDVSHGWVLYPIIL